MTFFKQNSARHRAETASHAVRNTTIAAAAGAAMIGSIAPAQAYAEVPAAAWSAPAASAATHYSAYTPQAPAAPQAASYVAPAAPQQAAHTSSVTPQSTRATEIAPSVSGGGIVGSAMQGVGAGYVWGGTAFGAWDCSGYTQWVFAQNGISLPRTTWAQFAAGTPVAQPQAGDLVSQNGGNHVGIYLGNGKMISALNPSQGTQIHSVDVMPVDGYYRVN